MSDGEAPKPEPEYVFGANIIENLTTGMYEDSRVMYREYIQNACDQIDIAEKLGILRPRDPNSRIPDLGEGTVKIQLNPEKRWICIEDNATGIKASEFMRTLGNIADSEKELGVHKGFRGIGRLCGLAYCSKLVFTSRWAGEDTVSIMESDAAKMREMLDESAAKIKRHTALDVLRAMSSFSARSATETDPPHFFRVELIDVNKENNQDLFGGRNANALAELKEFLSFVAPVPYPSSFIYRTEIYAHAKELGTRIDEYNITVEEEGLLKKYKTRLMTGNGEDQMYGVTFKDFRSDDGSLIAWMWFGNTAFKASIKEDEVSRGLRLRKGNIQLGKSDSLRSMFTDTRGNGYFVGEVFAESRELIPNSQRSYFNENIGYREFEKKVKEYFRHLNKLFNAGSDVNAAIKKITAYQEKAKVFKAKSDEGTFLNDSERERAQRDLEELRLKATQARDSLAKKIGKDKEVKEVYERRLKENPGENYLLFDAEASPLTPSANPKALPQKPPQDPKAPEKPLAVAKRPTGDVGKPVKKPLEAVKPLPGKQEPPGKPLDAAVKASPEKPEPPKKSAEAVKALPSNSLPSNSLIQGKAASPEKSEASKAISNGKPAEESAVPEAPMTPETFEASLESGPEPLKAAAAPLPGKPAEPQPSTPLAIEGPSSLTLNSVPQDEDSEQQESKNEYKSGKRYLVDKIFPQCNR
ncbi:MAG: ATP-binding protein, partial [Clostridiales bacterium]|nr:ATP-binding protein [Clostridiales bacterium]